METTIALSILGVGMIMVAAIFPVALTQHRESADTARALDLFAQAEAMLHDRLDPDLLWFDPALLVEGMDSAWLLIPFPNIDTNGLWSFDGANPNQGHMIRYADDINGRSDGLSSLFPLLGTDFMTDRLLPDSDARANQVPNRLLWYGFHRRLANGSRAYAVAVCKQRRHHRYFKQNLSVRDPTLNPTPLCAEPQRFPVPWRVTVARLPGSQILFNEIQTQPDNNCDDPDDPWPLADLAPAGSKIMIHGQTAADLLPVPEGAPGRILTVLDVVGPNAIQVLEDLGELVGNDPADPGDSNFVFDVWLYPPAARGVGFGPDSPLLEWKVAL